MLKVNLPKLSSAFLSTIHDVIREELPRFEPGYEYLKPGLADSMYFTNYIADLGKNEYQHFFAEKIFVFAMIIRPEPWINSAEKYVSSSYPPHHDHARTMGINYYIDCGGTNVKTVMYNETKYDNTDLPQLPGYELVTVMQEYHTDPNVWYAIEGSRFHSVENIESDRLLLTLSFEDLRYLDFCTKYKHLLL